MQMAGAERSVDCRTNVLSNLWYVVAGHNEVQGVDEANVSVCGSLNPRSACRPRFLAFLTSKRTPEHPDDRPDERSSAWRKLY